MRSTVALGIGHGSDSRKDRSGDADRFARRVYDGGAGRACIEGNIEAQESIQTSAAPGVGGVAGDAEDAHRRASADLAMAADGQNDVRRCEPRRMHAGSRASRRRRTSGPPDPCPDRALPTPQPRFSRPASTTRISSSRRKRVFGGNDGAGAPMHAARRHSSAAINRYHGRLDSLY